MHRLYFDNNATSPVHPSVIEEMTRALGSVWGNPSSVHMEGRLARQRLEESRESIASLIGSSPREVVFTSGGSESNNTALVGAALRLDQRCHIVTSAIEHPSVAQSAEWLRRRGHEVTFVGCKADGTVDPQEIAAAIRQDTAIVSLMLANNETGVIQPVAAVAALCRDRSIHLHCDGVQAAGRIPLDVKELGVDTFALAAHKMHGPKGIGALYVRSGVILEPYLSGGSQERRRRAGTESVPLAIGFAEAARLAVDEMDRWVLIASWRDELERELLSSFDGSFINGAGAGRLPNTSSVCFRGCDAEGIVIGLDLAGLAVSTGSACSSGRIEPSDVLIRMGISEDDARSSVRISLGRMNEDGEIREALELFRAIVPRNRKHPGKGAVSEPAASGVDSGSR
jgi:cysteine desulfurase